MRTLTPLTFAVGGIAFFLPKTGSNILKITREQPVVSKGLEEIRGMWNDWTGGKEAAGKKEEGGK